MTRIRTVWLAAAIYLLVPLAVLWAAPTITSISPTSGPPLTQVTVNGSGFGTSRGTVSFNSVAGAVVSWSATQVIVNAPDGSSGSGPVIVNWSSNGVTFNFTPTIKGISPQNVPAGQTVSVTGQNFGSSAGSVTLAGQSIQIVSWSNTSISIKVPANAPTGADPVVVTTSIGSSPSATLNVQFAPAVSGISPTFGPPSTQVTISGTGFGQNTAGRVSFNGVSGTINSWSDTQIVVTAPNGSAGSGPVVVSWQGLSSNSFIFNFLPTIFNLSPSNVGVGWTFAVVGQNFGSRAGSVTLNGSALAPSSWSSNSINIPVLSADCTGPIVVTTAIGASNSSTLTVQGTSCAAPLAVVASATPTADSAGWNNTNVTVSFTCTGGVAPVQCPAAQTVTTEGANQIITGTATDGASHTATATKTLNIDQTVPVLSIASPANGATSTSSSISVSGSASDSLSGLAGVACNGVAGTVQAGSFTCPFTLVAGANTISVQATDLAGNTTSQLISDTLIVPTTISSFSPSSAPIGSLVTVQGTGFAQTGFPSEVTLNQDGGGTIIAPISGATASTLSFVIPSGAASGPITTTVDGLTTTSSSSLSVVSSSTFSMTAGPASATLLPGQSTTVQVSLASSDGFSQLAALSVAGLPSGVTASFQPSQITTGQFSILTLSAPTTQAAGSSQFTISANALVQGIQETQSANVSLNVPGASGGTSFIGQVAITDAYDTPLAGVTVSFTGKNYSGTSTGCTASTTTDAAGNFELSGLPDACSGAQMVQYDPSTVIFPPGKYSGVTLSYMLTSGQVTTPGIIVHLPKVTNAETFTISQNSSSDQTFVSKSIPGVTFTIYAGTTFSLPDGTQPDPFPLSIVEIPYDKLPEKMPPDPTQDPVFAMSIEPDNSSSSQPIAISYPNRKNTPPGTNMPLTSLNPTMGMMVNYGTGTVSSDGTQVIPDPDPANPGHQYGVSHFDWFYPAPQSANASNPSPDPQNPKAGDPVDVFSGLLVMSKTDIAIGGARGEIAITRTYRNLTPNFGPFGIGTNFNYDYFLDTTYAAPFGGKNGRINLIMPDGNQFPFVQQPDGTFINSTIPSMLGAVFSNVQCIPDIPFGPLCNAALKWKNGTIYQFHYSGINGAYLASITDTNGNTTSLTHAPGDAIDITQITDPAGRSFSLNYDSNRRVTSITDPIGRSVSYTYNSQGTLATVTDENGGVTSYTYDSQNNLLTITDPRGIKYLQNTYDQNGRVIKQIAADGGVTTLAYTLLNPAASTTVTGGTSIGGGGSIPNINTSPAATTIVTDPLGNKTTYHFNTAGFLLGVVDSLGGTVVRDVDPSTNLTLSATDSLGRVTAYTYDASGNTASITRLAGTPNAVTTTYTYDPVFNNVATSADSLGHKNTYKYDAKGNLLSRTDPLGQETTFAYDSFGELAAMSDPMGNATKFTYSGGALIATVDPLQRTVTRVADVVGRTISITDPSGITEQYQYNALDQIAQSTDALGNQTVFNYDTNGNLLSIGDAKQQTTSYTYDSMDRVATRSDSLGRVESYQYDLNGNLTQFIDRRGKVDAFSYDALDRKTGSTFGPGESSISYSYDAMGRLVQAADSIAGPIARSYDALDRLTSEVTPEGDVSYSYDLSGRRTAMQASGAPSTNYIYDDDDRLKQIGQGTSTVSFAYDPTGRRISLALPNGIVVNYGYDTASQLSGINYQLGNALLGNLTYSYDLSGRRIAVGGTFARTGVPQAVSANSYNSGNELTKFGAANLTYDANGNLTSDGVNAYTWDARNELTSVSGSVSASFQYDAFGRRVMKTIGVASTGFLYDGVNPAQETSAGIPVATLLTGLGLDEHFQRTDSAGQAVFLTDALGSTLALTGSNGTVLEQYSYEAFGKASSVGTSKNSFQYAAREDDGTGLDYYRARYYSPSLGRFISEDPIGVFGGSVNFYGYARNNPISYFDPLGFSASSGRKARPCGPDGYRDAEMDDAAVVLQEAKSYQGVPYQLNGANSNYDGTDCSGLVHNAVSNSGINPSVGYSQANNIGSNPGYRAFGPGDQPMPGDVVVFPVPGGTGHAGFYDPADNPNNIYSATSSGGVRKGDPGWFPGGKDNQHFYRVRVPCNP